MDIKDLQNSGWIIFEVYRGSYVYGTYIEGVSDKDVCGVYIQPLEDILGFKKYIPQIQDESGDCVYYEIGRLFELLKQNNPNILEILNTPDEYVLFKNPVFDILLKEKEKFVTKVCASTFGGYANAQITKAKRQDKMMNWEASRVTRKTPLDFCYIIDGHKTKSLKRFLQQQNYEQKFCGVTNVPNARDVYALFYDSMAHNCFSNSLTEEDKRTNKQLLKNKGLKVGLGYKGLEKVDETDNYSISNALRLSSIPKSEKCVCVFTYNKDSYTQHCRDYKKYQNWLKNRNINRWVEVTEQKKSNSHKENKIDGKNMLHCVRLIDMAIEIAEGKGVVVKRPNTQALLDIRSGKVDLDTLINESESKISKMIALFQNSNLPENVCGEFVHKLLVKIRKKFYEKN